MQRNTSRRYTIRFRAIHPLEARVLEAIDGLPKGLKAQRLREFLLASTGRRSPNVPWEQPSSMSNPDAYEELQLTVPMDDPRMAPIAAVLTALPAKLATEYLRDRILAGIAGEASCDIVILGNETNANEATPTRAAPAAPVATPALQATTSKGSAPERVSESVRPTLTVVPASVSDSVVIDGEDGEPKKRSDLKGLFS